jgi:Fe-S cluster biogenesis protein NfuA
MSAAGAPPDAEAAGRRVEEVLDRLAASGDREACTAAEELVRALMDFYGAGLGRVVSLLGQTEPKALQRLLRDEPFSALLVLHDLHPESLEVRIGRALDSLPGHPVELVGFDADRGVLRVRPVSSGGCGCGSGDDAVRESVEDALACFAGEVRSVELEAQDGAAEPVLLQISRRPAPADAS